MPVTVSLKFNQNMTDLERRIQGTMAAIKYPQKALRKFGHHMTTIGARSIKEQADPVTKTPWRGLSNITLDGRPGGGGGGIALYDRGRLIQSLLASKIEVTADSVSIGTNVVYAAMMQNGGTLRPKSARALAIPLNREAARAGGARRWWDKNSDRHPFIFHPRGNENIAFIAYKAGVKDKTLKLMYLLRASVVIPARPFLGFGERDQVVLAYILENHFLNQVGETGI